MAFETFPLPAGQPNLADLTRRLQVNASRLSGIIVELNSALWDRIAAQEAMLGTVETSLRQSITKRNGNTLKKLKAVVEPLFSSVIERNAITDAALANLHQSIELGQATIGELHPEHAVSRQIMYGPNPSDPKGSCIGYAPTVPSPTVTPIYGPHIQPIETPSPPVATPAYDRPFTPYAGPQTYTLWHNLDTGCETWTPDSEPSPGPRWVFVETVQAQFWSPTNPVWPAVTPFCNPPATPRPPIETPNPPIESPGTPVYPAPPITAPVSTSPRLPDEPLPPMPSGTACGDWWGWVTPIAPPGSAEWCQWADMTIKGLAAMEDAVWGYIQQSLDPNNIEAYTSGWQPYGSLSFPPGYVIDALLSIVKRIASAGRPILQTLKDMIACFRELYKKLFSRCNVRAVSVLTAIKTLVESIKRNRIGTDAFAWVTIDLVFVLDQLEHTLDYLLQYACPMEAPSVPEAIEAYLRGYISDDLLHCIQRIHGQDPDSFRAMVLAAGEKIGPREAINWVRRQGGSTADEKEQLRKLGWIDDEQTDKFQELYWEIPTIGDHLEWLRKNVFDPEYVRDFNLLDGFGTTQDIADVGYPDYVKLPITKDSANFWRRFGRDLTTLGMRKENAANHYAAHWLNPSFTQLFDMTQRLRPGRVDASHQFTRDDLLRVMQEMDVGPYFRERLEKVAHPVINLTLLMKLFGLRAVSDDEFLEGLQDLGYTLHDATVMRDGLRFDIARLRASSGRGWTPTALARLYSLGLVSDDFVGTKMGLLGYSDAETQDLLDRSPLEAQARIVQRAKTRSLAGIINTSIAAYRCGATDREQFASALSAIGIDADTSSAWADNIDASVQVDLCKQQVASIRAAVFKGKITVDEARQKLIDSGMPDLRSSQYVTSWKIQLESRSPTATASQLLRWVSEGLMDADTAQSRLSNLGWADADIAVSLAESRGRLAVRQARSEAARAKDERTRANTLAQLVLDASEDTDRLKRQLKTVESVSRLQKWYELGVIDAGYFTERMQNSGYGQEMIDKYKGEIDAKLAAKAAKAAQKKR